MHIFAFKLIYTRWLKIISLNFNHCTFISKPGLVYGHTGHVRFLTSVEISSTASTKAELAREGEGAVVERTGGFSFQDIHRRSSMAATTATMASRMLVISGGDGYEDFRNSAANEGAGRDDSTNHLLLWQV